ncbi:MAG TPA: M48 family metalloprotease, partial [Jatrophihabitantaceae bacterium]|nr:M48 family metalloprotease [Jatrophihabitantaceae bacterium]
MATKPAPAAVNFFARQQSARGTSAKLVALFTLAVIAIIGAVDLVVFIVASRSTVGGRIAWIVVATVVTVLIIVGGTVSKMVTLRAGGAAVALSVGAVPVDPTTSDPQLRRFINVVEEMSIASGVPMPRLFVLEREEGINAFAAGYTAADAAITVTGGALHRLNRDELQGVIGHEFSHVLNGDMRINVRLIGLLAGILLLGLIGLRVLAFGGGRSRDSKGSPILFIAIAFLVLGFVGQFFAQLIQAAVSRQREWLADASSVQFTRQTTGLVGSLKKIAGLPTGSALQDTASERQVNHMLFGEGKRSFSALWATHPPLLERIQALEPGFRRDEIKQLRDEYRADPPNGMAEDAALGLVSGPTVVAPSVSVSPEAVAARVGTFSPDDLARGAAISAQVPAALRQLASQPSTAANLVLALLLDRDDAVRARQAVMAGPDATALYPQVADLTELLRLPLIGIAMSAVVARPPQQADRIVATIDDLAKADGTYSLFEYCASRLVSTYLLDARDPVRRSRPGRGSVRQVQDAALTLLARIAAAGNSDPTAAEHAYAAGVARLMPGSAVPPFVPPPNV